MPIPAYGIICKYFSIQALAPSKTEYCLTQALAPSMSDSSTQVLAPGLSGKHWFHLACVHLWRLSYAWFTTCICTYKYLLPLVIPLRLWDYLQITLNSVTNTRYTCVLLNSDTSTRHAWLLNSGTVTRHVWVALVSLSVHMCMCPSAHLSHSLAQPIKKQFS